MKFKIALAVASIVTLASSGVAHADSTVITNTGPDSNNSVVINNVVTSVVTNVNTSVVTNTNDQTGTTGDAQVNDNTFGGGATSGSVNNSNSFSTMIAISNPGMGGVSLIPGSSQTPSAITAGGGGGVGEASISASAGTLPKTGGDGIDTSIFDKLWRAPKGVIAPLAKAGADFSWPLTALAAILAAGSGYLFDQYQKQKQNRLTIA